MALRTLGKYSIDRLIKRGGMGAVYLGFDPDLKRRAAIKVLRDDLEGDDDRERFRREAVAIAALDHPNIIRIFHAGVDDGRPYIAMEYVPGETLAELMRRDAALSLERKLEIVEDVCRALEAAHRAGIVHRDIKPANVLVAQDGTVKVIDFGIARTPDTTLTQLGTLLGTLDYMAPEQFSDGGVDARTDIFAVGVLLYELIARKRPFAGDLRTTLAPRGHDGGPLSLSVLCPEIDADIAVIVATALEHDPARRYQDVQSLRSALTTARQRVSAGADDTLVSPRAGTAVPAASLGRGGRVFPWRGTAAAGAIGLAAVAALAAGIGRMATGDIPLAPPVVQPPALPETALPPVVPVDVPAPRPIPPPRPERAPVEPPASRPVTVTGSAPRPPVEPPPPSAPKWPDFVAVDPESPRADVESPPLPPPPALPEPPDAPQKPASAAREREADAVREIVKRYMQAMSERNLAGMAAFRDLDPAMKAELQAQFQQLRSWKVTLPDPFVVVNVDASRATVTGRIKFEDVRASDDRRGRVRDRNVTIELRKTAGAWHITDID